MVKIFSLDDSPFPDQPGPKMDLTIDLVPNTAWEKNVRTQCPKAVWDKIRKATYRRAGYRCEVCGESGLDQGRKWPVECHEIWHYDEESVIQKLVGLVALCPECHEVKHTGRAIVVGGPAAMDRVVARLMRVNQWPVKAAHKHIEDSFKVWKGRSAKTWALDLSFLDGA